MATSTCCCCAAASSSCCSSQASCCWEQPPFQGCALGSAECSVNHACACCACGEACLQMVDWWGWAKQHGWRANASVGLTDKLLCNRNTQMWQQQQQQQRGLQQACPCHTASSEKPAAPLGSPSEGSCLSCPAPPGARCRQEARCKSCLASAVPEKRWGGSRQRRGPDAGVDTGRALADRSCTN